MAKKTNTYLLLGLAAIAFYFLSKKSTNILEGFSLKKLKLLSPSFRPTGVTLPLQLTLENLNDFQIQLERLTGNLYWGNVPLAPANLAEDELIGAMEESVLDVDVDVNFANLGLSIVQLITSGSIFDRIYFSGKAKTDIVPAEIPVTKNILKVG